METENWKTMILFDKPVNGKDIRFVDSPLEKPKGLDELIREKWDGQLKNKQAALLDSGIRTELRPYHEDKSENPLNALYEGEKVRMWPGPTISLKELKQTPEGVDLFVGQTSYPFIAALKEKDVTELYESQGVQKPQPPIAVCTYALTKDNKLVLTIRGERTDTNPCRFYGQGGNPKFTDDSIIKTQLNEMEEEALIRPREVDQDNFMFSGIGVYKVVLPDKPDLLGWVKVDVDSIDLRKRVYDRAISDRPTDAVGISFAPADREGLYNYLVNETHPVQFAALGHAGLVMYGYSNFGKEWIDQLSKRIQYSDFSNVEGK
jgi:hypothetical protein